MGCVESFPLRFHGTRLTEERESFEIDDIECKKVQWTKMLISRSLTIDFRDYDNRTFYEESDFVVECLRLHNLFRNRHSAPSLKLSQELCHSAQSWANHLTHTGLFYHRNVPDLGENVYCKWSYSRDCDVIAKEAVEYWYNDHVRYNYDMDSAVLHVNANAFTQMIWVSTEQLGIGKARSRNGKYIVVANYFPPGNVPKLFIDNVLPPLSRGDDGESRESGTHSLRAPSDKSIDNESFELEEWETTYLPFQSEAAKLSSSWDYSSVKSQL